MAALLYLGAGAGMGAVNLIRGSKIREAKITGKELPYTIGIIALDIAASIFLIFGISMTTAATASLMNNFEIVATAMIALAVFKEAVGRRAWIAIILITAASITLSVEDFGTLSISSGAIFVLLACICWGLENNFTRMLSLKNPLQIVMIKGLGAGFGSLIIAAALSELSVDLIFLMLSLLLGFLSFGLSVYFYIRAQRQLGAARTSAYYAFAPFVGAGLSFMFFGQQFAVSFWIALTVMVVGTCFVVSEKHIHPHIHEAVAHEHRHSHGDEHHGHSHGPSMEMSHSHMHSHLRSAHMHEHTPDLHHVHTHGKSAAK